MKLEEQIQSNIMQIELTRHFSRIWNGRDSVLDLFRYITCMQEDLNRIHEHYKKEFKALDGNSIDCYINIFNRTCDEIFKICYTPEQYKKMKTLFKKENKTLPFYNLIAKYHDDELHPSKIMLSTKIGGDYGIKAEHFKQLAPLANKLFLIEKYCSISTRKIWESEIITDPAQLNTDENFRILVKVVFPTTWRGGKISESTQKFLKSKKYQSTSFIDQDHKRNLFLFKQKKLAACLMVSTSGENIICGGDSDVWSTETIDGRDAVDFNSFNSEHSAVMKVHSSIFDNKEHVSHAIATEIVTPKGLFGADYNEIVVMNPKYVAVISPDRSCDKFAEKLAKEKNLPIKYM